MARKAKKTRELGELNFLVCFILMTLILISSNYLSTIELNIAGYDVLASMFIYPFVYLCSTLITKKDGREKALIAVLLVALLQAGYYICLNLICTTDIEALTVTGSIVSFLTSQVAIIFLYHSISKDNKLTNKASLFVLYVFAILIDNLIFLSVFNVNTTGNFEMIYAISSAVKSFVALAIVYIGYLIEKERS